MASRIEHRAEFAQGIGEVFAALSEKAALQARLDAIGGQNAQIRSYSHSGDEWRFLLHQGISADQLPSIIRTLQAGDLVVVREQTWTGAGELYTGTVQATVSGMPGEITARTELTVTGGTTVLRTSGSVKIRIPLIGGKIEGFVAEQVTKLLASEADFTAKWLAERS